ncbi:UNVERIFIED_CONTAM: oxidoreductase GLYR1-like protein [Trichonephila clavipes]
MEQKDFATNDLVWAKMKHFPFWPARIVNPPIVEKKDIFTTKGQQKKKSSRCIKARHYVLFFGSKNFSWITDENIVRHSPEMLNKVSRLRSDLYVKAIKEIVEASGSVVPKETGKEDSVKNDESSQTPTALRNLEKITKTTSITDDGLLKKPTTRYTKRGRALKQKIKREKIKKSHQEENLTEETSDKQLPPVKKLSVMSDDCSVLISNASPNNTYNQVAVIQPLDEQSMVEHENIKKSQKRTSTEEASDKELSSIRKLPRMTNNESFVISNAPTNNINQVAATQPFTSRSTVAQEVFELPPGPSYDSRPSTSTTVNGRNITPTSKKIGFIGMGTMGQRIVMNLLNSGHDVSVWNRTLEKCKNVITLGARKFLTPAELVSHCDIIFCCVSGPRASKSVVFQEDGILQGLEKCEPGTKDYVELTCMLPQTSKKIAEAITRKGGRYLEAPMVGSWLSAENGKLIIHAAGDYELFCRCSTVFSATCRRTFFISREVGNALPLSIVFRVIWKVIYFPVFFAMQLAEKFGMDDFLAIYN